MTRYRKKDLKQIKNTKRTNTFNPEMSCNICATNYSFFRIEKGCPSCGYSCCSKCLKNKVYLEKYKSKVLVCDKCKNGINNPKPITVEPPDAINRFGAGTEKKVDSSGLIQTNTTDQQILKRVNKLKEDAPSTSVPTEEEITLRLQKIKDIPSTSDAEIQSRLANLKGIPIISMDKPVIPLLPDKRTDQEKVNDLLKEYTEKHKIDKQYTDELDKVFSDVESRLNKLKENPGKKTEKAEEVESSDDEETIVKKIVEKIKIEANHEDDEDEVNRSSNDELPFCEICNEDATMRCLGCRYLFCKRCFIEHKDDDDGCNRYEPYPKKKV